MESRGMIPPARTLKQILQRFVQTRVWKMDIAPTAWIATSALIDRTWPRGVHIGERCIIDHHAVILTHDMTRGLYLDTVIADDCTIGARAIIFPGVRIGHGSHVAPGAVVLRDVAPNSTVVGNPARLHDGMFDGSAT